MIPEISIIIPIFNAAATLSRCIDSCLQQTFRNLEIILVNDGSTDRSAEICNRYSKLDEHIVFLDLNNNGVSSARNRGIHEARGTFLLFLDSDDYIDENLCKTLIDNMTSHIDLMVYGYFTENGEKKNKFYLKEKNYSKQESMNLLMDLKDQNALFICWNKLFKRDKIKAFFSIDMTFAEDSVFVFQYLKNCTNVKVISFIGYHYTLNNSNSAIRRYHDRMIDMCLKEYETIISFKLKDETIRQFAINHFMENVWYFIVPSYLKNESIPENEKHCIFKMLSRDSSIRTILKCYQPSSKFFIIIKFCILLNLSKIVYKVWFYKDIFK